MKYLSFFVLAIVVFSCSKEDCGEPGIDLQACFDESIEYTQSDQNYRDYIENRTKWECLDIQDYEVTYTQYNQGCYSGVLRLRIENGEIVDQTELPSTNPDIHQAWCDGRTVDDILASIEYAVDSVMIYENYDSMNFWDSLHYVAYKANITYDTIYYFPDSFYIDIHGGYADDEFSATFSDFEEIK